MDNKFSLRRSANDIAGPSALTRAEPAGRSFADNAQNGDAFCPATDITYHGPKHDYQAKELPQKQKRMKRLPKAIMEFEELTSKKEGE